MQIKNSNIDNDSDSKLMLSEYINSSWSVLKYSETKDNGTLIALPNPYIIPGGRFQEQFYWDSYFIMLGLLADGYLDIAEGIVKNAAYMIDKFGFIPTANRTNYLSRSQPPFFSRMIMLLAEYKGESVILEYLPQLLSEYKFWMEGDHAVRMPNGSILNRYYDSEKTPRPEMADNDIKISSNANWRRPDSLYLDIRAGAESGWDFSSRWFNDPMDIRTIQTTNIIPIDLNCLLYQLEATIAKAYKLSGELVTMKKFEELAKCRNDAINVYCWSESEGFYFDYNLSTNKSTGRLTIASVFPLFSGIANKEQAEKVQQRLENDFLKQGGLVTTLIETGQQWDSPNGWAPLQWLAIKGLRNYGYCKLADEIKDRWIKTNMDFFVRNHKLVEKYNVINVGESGGGGEYPLQDGFGWTNGVLSALLHRFDN